MSTKSRAYEILRKNGTLERIRAQLQLAVFESMGLQNQKSTTSKTSRPSRREIGKLAKREFQSLLSLLRMPLAMKMFCTVLISPYMILFSVFSVQKFKSNARTIQINTPFTDTIVTILNKYDLNSTKTIFFKEIGSVCIENREEEKKKEESSEYSDEDFEDQEEDGFSTPPDEVESSMEEVENINNLTKQEEDLSSFLSDTDMPDTSSLVLREEILEAKPERISSYDVVINLH